MQWGGLWSAWSARGHSSDWLVVRELGVSIIKFLVPTCLGVYVLVVSIQSTTFTWWDFSICKTAQGI